MPTRPKNARIKTESKSSSSDIQAPKGKLGIMIPGMGAVATTFVAGVEAVRKGIAKPIGSLTQMGTIRLGKRTDALHPRSRNSFLWPGSTTWSLLAGTFLTTTCTRRPRRPACWSAICSTR